CLSSRCGHLLILPEATGNSGCTMVAGSPNRCDRAAERRYSGLRALQSAPRVLDGQRQPPHALVELGWRQGAERQAHEALAAAGGEERQAVGQVQVVLR